METVALLLSLFVERCGWLVNRLGAYWPCMTIDITPVLVPDPGCGWFQLSRREGVHTGEAFTDALLFGGTETTQHSLTACLLLLKDESVLSLLDSIGIGFPHGLSDMIPSSHDLSRPKPCISTACMSSSHYPPYATGAELVPRGSHARQRFMRRDERELKSGVGWQAINGNLLWRVLWE